MSKSLCNKHVKESPFSFAQYQSYKIQNKTSEEELLTKSATGVAQKLKEQ